MAMHYSAKTISLASTVALFLFFTFFLAARPKEGLLLKASQDTPIYERRLCYHQGNVSIPSDKTSYDFVLLHLPKAGGSTIETTLGHVCWREFDTFPKLFRDSELIQLTPSTMFLENSTALPRPCGFAMGHNDYQGLGLEKIYSERSNRAQPEFINAAGRWRCGRSLLFVRDPVKRFISTFYTSIGRRTSTSHLNFVLQESLAKTRAVDPDRAIMWEKIATGNVTISEVINYPKPEHFGCFRRLASMLAPDHRNTADSEQLLQVLRHRALEFDFIGLVEEMETSMEMFSYTFDLNLARYVSLHNKNLYPQDVLSEQDLMRLQDLLYVEIKFYEFARTIFEGRRSSFDATIPRDPFVCGESYCEDLETTPSKVTKPWMLFCKTVCTRQRLLT